MKIIEAIYELAGALETEGITEPLTVQLPKKAWDKLHEESRLIGTYNNNPYGGDCLILDWGGPKVGVISHEE